MKIKSTLIIYVSLLLAGCWTSYPEAQPRLTSEQAVYRLGPGDTVNVTVFDEPNLSGKFVVDSNGEVAVPLAGKINVKDKTELESSITIASTLQKGGYLRHPKVTVETVNMRPFFVMGEVERAGQFPFQNGLTVHQAVAMAGGYSYRADRDDITISRPSGKGVGTEIRLLANEDTPVLPGDVIEIGERFF